MAQEEPHTVLPCCLISEPIWKYIKLPASLTWLTKLNFSQLSAGWRGDVIRSVRGNRAYWKNPGFQVQRPHVQNSIVPLPNNVKLAISLSLFDLSFLVYELEHTMFPTMSQADMNQTEDQ